MDQFLGEAEIDSLGLEVGERTKISRDARFFGSGRITIGNDCRIDAFCILSSGGSGYVDIGDRVHVGASSRLFGGGGITIEPFAAISVGVSVFSESDDFTGFAMVGTQVPDELRMVRSGHIRIRRHAALAAHAIVLPGALLNEGSVLGAASVSSSRLKDWTIYQGNPAKPVGTRRRAPLSLELKIDGVS